MKKKNNNLIFIQYFSLIFLAIFFILVLYLNQYFYFLYYTENLQNIFGKASCLPDNCFCEKIYYNRIAQPINSFTNIFYLYVGIGILFSLQKWELFSILYSYIVLFLGFSSFFYHSTMTFFGQWLDVFFMYVYVLFLIAYIFYKNKIFDKNIIILIYFILIFFSGIFLYYFPLLRRILFGVYVILTLFAFGIVIKKNKIQHKKYFFKALFYFFVAYSIWILDYYKIICNPYSWVQGHGIWHLMNSFVILYLYLFFKKNFIVQV